MNGAYIPGIPCSGCTPAESTSAPAGRIKWRPVFARNQGRPILETSKPIATIVCPGPSAQELPLHTKRFISEETDAWGVNEISYLRDFKFKFLHVEPFVYENGGQDHFGNHAKTKFIFNRTAHGGATVLCEQGCQWLERQVEGPSLQDGGFCDYATYTRACMQGDCYNHLEPKGRPPWEYHPWDTDGEVLVPMGNSMNRILDLVVRLGYHAVLFAGCDGSAKKDPTLPAGIDQGKMFKGKWIHSSQVYGYQAWSVLFDEFTMGFLRFNYIEKIFSLTPNPLGHANSVKQPKQFCLSKAGTLMDVVNAAGEKYPKGAAKPKLSECDRLVSVDGYSMDTIKVRSLNELIADFDNDAFVEGGGNPKQLPYHLPIGAENFS